MVVGRSIRVLQIGILAAALAAMTAMPAAARSHHASRHHARHHAHAAAAADADAADDTTVADEAPRARVIQCVAFARADTGIELSGNARNWWDNAAGVYDRGSAPEVGSVLSFRANPRMRLGHVAVVSSVISPRVVQIDQSHWASGGISRNIAVIDVSQDNDWSQVRVALGHGSSFGAIYPTDGFIYPRPDRGGVIAPAAIRRAPSETMPITIASADITGTSALDAANAAAQDAEENRRAYRRHGVHRRHEVTMEVAEAPDAPTR